jgi:hypothetical protein
MAKALAKVEPTRGTKKALDSALESMKLWSQTMMLRLYAHMEIESAGMSWIDERRADPSRASYD